MSVVETRTGSQGGGASLGMVDDSDCRGLDDRAADAGPVMFRKGGASSRPPSIVTDPWTAISDGEDKKWMSNMSY